MRCRRARRPPTASTRRSWRSCASSGIDLADREPKLLTRELAEQADVVVTMGCGDECPYIPGRRYLDWDLEDPKGRPLDEVRATRDDIDRRVRELVEELDA